MADQTWEITVNEDTVAKVDTIVQGMIDDFWNYIDANHTPSAIYLVASLSFNVQNGTPVARTFPFTLNWYEDATVQNTRMKNIWAAFTAGLTAMEGASSYTTVNLLAGTITLTVTYT